MDKLKKTVGTDIQHQLKKQYEKQLKNGTKIEIKISLEISNLNKLDFNEVLSGFAANSHNFYLYTAENIKNKFS